MVGGKGGSDRTVRVEGCLRWRGCVDAGCRLQNSGSRVACGGGVARGGGRAAVVGDAGDGGAVVGTPAAGLRLWGTPAVVLGSI